MSSMQSLCQYLAASGGLALHHGDYETSGSSDMRQSGAHLWHRNRPFARKLCRDDGTGIAPDAAALAAWEAGFFPLHSERPDLNELLDAIDDEMRGKPHYRLEDAERLAIQESESECDYDPADYEPISLPADDDAGRKIPPGSIRHTTENGGAVYLYQTDYVTKKGRAGITYYAKAFAYGSKIAAWHHAYKAETDRAEAIAAWGG